MKEESLRGGNRLSQVQWGQKGEIQVTEGKEGRNQEEQRTITTKSDD